MGAQQVDRAAQAPHGLSPASHPSGHSHLWRGEDGTQLHAPPGQLVREESSGKVCCHLCGRWFTFLGAHARVHGHTAGTYRELIGLCRTPAQAAEQLSGSIRRRIQKACQQQPAARDGFAAGQQLARSGQLAWLARSARVSRLSPTTEGRRIRTEQLSVGAPRSRSATISGWPMGCGSWVRLTCRATCGRRMRTGRTWRSWPVPPAWGRCGCGRPWPSDRCRTNHGTVAHTQAASALYGEPFDGTLEAGGIAASPSRCTAGPQVRSRPLRRSSANMLWTVGAWLKE